MKAVILLKMNRGPRQTFILVGIVENPVSDTHHTPEHRTMRKTYVLDWLMRRLLYQLNNHHSGHRSKPGAMAYSTNPLFINRYDTPWNLRNENDMTEDHER